MTEATQIATCSMALATAGDATTGPSWVHLLPAGTFAGRDGRGPYQADDAAAIMNISRQIAGRSEIPVDYEHQIDFAAKNGQPAPAAGWIKGLQSRTDGIWGLVEWTARAAQHLAAREYRYLSPAFTHTAAGKVTAILRASLVNNPNLDQLTALASMEPPAMPDPNPNALAQLRQLLGLPADGDLGAILAAIRDLQTQRMSASAPNPAEYVPIGDFLRVTQELTRVHQGVEEQTAKMHVEEKINAGLLLPFMRDWAINLCTVNKPAFDQFLSKTGPAVHKIFEPSGARLTPPAVTLGGRSSTHGLSETDAHVAAMLGHSPEAFAK